MKKTLVTLFLLVFVLSVAASAVAAPADPFADVPAKHWAYDAVRQLAKAGIVEGYSDGTFRGQNTITRYEMAIIIANAMTKLNKADVQQKALIDKLANEFNSELVKLGARVDKLEKKASNIKLSGDLRVRYRNLMNSGDKEFRERFGLDMYSQINENNDFYGRLQYGHTEQGTSIADQGSDMHLQYAYVVTKDALGSNTDVTLGRQPLKFGSAGYFFSGATDAFQVRKKFADVDFAFGYGDFSTSMNTAAGKLWIDRALFATLKYAPSRATNFYVGYLDESKDPAKGSTYFKMFNLAMDSDLGNGFKLVGEYYKNTDTDGTSPKGYVARLAYKGAKQTVQGSWGMWAEYVHNDANALPTATDYNSGSLVGTASDKKFWDISVSYTLSKNVVFRAFETFQTKKVSDGGKMPNLTRLEVNYFF